MILTEAEKDMWSDVDANHAARVQTLTAVMMALRFSDAWRKEAKDAESALLAAVARAERARDLLARTTETLDQAVRTHSRGRT